MITDPCALSMIRIRRLLKALTAIEKARSYALRRADDSVSNMWMMTIMLVG